MTTRDEELAKKLAIAKALLGKTTGASKGFQPPPDPKLKAYPTKDGLKAKLTMKF